MNLLEQRNVVKRRNAQGTDIKQIRIEANDDTSELTSGWMELGIDGLNGKLLLLTDSRSVSVCFRLPTLDEARGVVTHRISWSK